MITELEQEFFKVFGIKPYCVRSCTACYLEQGIDAWEKFNCENTDCDKCEHDKSIWEYPEITDRKLLEMICIIVQSKALLPIFVSENIENLKDEIIQMTIDAEIKFKHNNKIDLKPIIQQLFKEGE